MIATERRAQAPRSQPAIDRDPRPLRRPNPLPRIPAPWRSHSPLPPTNILKPGRNCWRIEQAERAAFLVDAANYFCHLDAALRRARRSIMIVGWDFDASTRLCPDRTDETLGALLRSLVEANPELEVRILVWSLSVVYAPSATLPALLGEAWRDHPRITFRLDGAHPLYGSHHQKVVTIDDAVAYMGGIDLTVQRWDRCDHAVGHDDTRLGPDGTRYEPVHDVQMAVSGRAARAIADLARDRWVFATSEKLSPPAPAGDPWPTELAADLHGVPIAISRTMPPLVGVGGVTEGKALVIDALRTARQWIYIEAQYLTADAIGDVLEESLMRRDGPEIVVLQTKSSRGRLEQWIMGSNRDRLLRRLWMADRHRRLKAYFPVIDGPDGPCEIKVHSKLIMADGRFLRIGSSNLNNRSMGLDTECDLALEARDERTRRAILKLRNVLIGEHLAVAPERVAAALASSRSLIAAIEHLNADGRCLQDFVSIISPTGPTTPIAGTAIFDPEVPFDLFGFLRGRPLLPAPGSRALNR